MQREANMTFSSDPGLPKDLQPLPANHQYGGLTTTNVEPPWY